MHLQMHFYFVDLVQYLVCYSFEGFFYCFFFYSYRNKVDCFFSIMDYGLHLFKANLMFTHNATKKKYWQNPLCQFLMFITFSIISFAGLAHTASFFRVSTSTHSQAVCSATYMQFNAVITSVRLFQGGTHVLATRLNKDTLLFHHFFSSPLRILSGDDCFLLCCARYFKAFSPTMHKERNSEDLLASPALFFFFLLLKAHWFCRWGWHISRQPKKSFWLPLNFPTVKLQAGLPSCAGSLL